MTPLNRTILFGLILATAIGVPTSTSAATRTVTFNGTPLLGVGTLSCPSTPSVGTLTVGAGETVTFINETGKTASLHVGAATSTVAVHGSHSTRFADAGTVQVTMIPACALDLGTHQAVTVTVCAADSSPTPSVSAAAAGPTHTAGKTTTHTTEQQARAVAAPIRTPSPTPTHTPEVITAVIPAGPQPPANATLILIACVLLVTTGGWWIYRLRERDWRLVQTQ